MSDSFSQPIPRGDRRRLRLYRDARFSPNIEFMDHLLDFIEERFGLLPCQSQSNLICFRPQFTAFVSSNKTCGGLHISLFGECFFSGQVVRGKFPNWRKYIITHGDYLPTAERLIEQAHSHRVDANDNGRWTYHQENAGLTL
jgi:hypothetical protein